MARFGRPDPPPGGRRWLDNRTADDYDSVHAEARGRALADPVRIATRKDQRMTAPADPQAVLRGFRKTQDFFIGIDSDGCAFDTMEVKHKECFIPNIIRFFGLAAVSKYAREAAEFINLYSHWRGINRFPALTMSLDLLAERPEVKRRHFLVPALTGVRRWIERETKLANSTLKGEVAATNDPDLALAYEWSEAVNRTVSEVVRAVPPFPFVRESLEKMAGRVDAMVVSATPGEALEREWEEHDLKKFVGLIAGQELGSKKEHLAMAAGGRYDKHKTLMIGDAPGDQKAAAANGVLFYPIDPGHEDESWQRFYEEALDRFLAGTYAGDYMAEQVARFEKLLPETPPWKTA
jgi:phosphoglycolate phosphatase-like HAD superfamily hydrolase